MMFKRAKKEEMLCEWYRAIAVIMKTRFLAEDEAICPEYFTDDENVDRLANDARWLHESLESFHRALCIQKYLSSYEFEFAKNAREFVEKNKSIQEDEEC